MLILIKIHLNIDSDAPPKVPSNDCFDGNNNVKLLNGNIVKFKDLNVEKGR